MLQQESVPTSLPGDNFVSVQFNLVLLIVLGLASVRSRRLACLVCCIAILIHLCSIYKQNRILLNAAWKDAPARRVTQSDVYDYLVLELVRRVASLIYAIFVCKSIARILSHRLVVATVCEKWLWVLPICAVVFLRAWRDFLTLRSITNDRGIYFYFISAQMMDAIRAAFQVALVISSREVTKISRNDSRCNTMTHTFVLSSLVLVQNVLSYEIGLFSAVDIVLQLSLMKQISWAYVRIVDFVGALLSLPVSLIFPPFDDDIVPDDLVETINLSDWNWLNTDRLHNDIDDVGIAQATTPSEYSSQHKPFIQAPSLEELKQWSMLYGGHRPFSRERTRNNNDADEFPPHSELVEDDLLSPEPSIFTPSLPETNKFVTSSELVPCH